MRRAMPTSFWSHNASPSYKGRCISTTTQGVTCRSTFVKSCANHSYCTDPGDKSCSDDKTMV
eukprot:scaffold7720_cov149-Amphora_coffeaeformis.AAC.3